MKHNRRFVHAHRVSWEMANGAPGDLCVLHRCDNPPCVRPDHLFLGTHLDNARDKTAKGRGIIGKKNGRYTHPERSARGERVNTAQLTESGVREILVALKHGAGLTELGRKYGVCKQAIYSIREGKTWKHVERL
ncbi:MAG: HNH endonuclease signature motif containing protein [Acidobacteriota bacterium]